MLRVLDSAQLRAWTGWDVCHASVARLLTSCSLRRRRDELAPSCRSQQSRGVRASLRDQVKPVSWSLIAIGILAWTAGAVVFFRYPLFSAFDAIFGERGDGRMIIYFHEHLFRALQGKAQFVSPGIFFPVRATLGLAPAFLLDLPLYATLRILGCDPFLAFQLLLILLSLLCFLATLTIAARYLDVHSWIALCAAALVTFANNLFVKAGAGHTNFLLLYYIPCIVCVALWGLEEFPRIVPRLIAGVAIAAALLALLFSTDVYTAWMFVVSMLIAAGTVIILRRRRVAALIRQYWRPLTVILALGTIAFTIAFVPFLLIYIPVRSIAPLRVYPEYLVFAPLPGDIANVSGWNLLWGWLVQFMRLRQGSEFMLAVTPGMTGLFLLLAFAMRKEMLGSGRWRTVFVACGVAVWAIGWLLTLRVGTFSGFWLVRYVVPGATGIRAGMRFQLIANIWIALGLAVSLDCWIRSASIEQLRCKRMLAGGVLLFCLVEQINVMNNSRLPRSRELSFLAAVPKPPTECRAFFVDAPRPADYLDQHDAMWISLQAELPTLNGIAGWTPPGWEFMGAADNTVAARRWLAYTRLSEQVCIYDRSAHRWSLFK
jgi:hypothetical protein